jgi:16S rRNA (guanine966-N2)-methyltransferase
VRVVAGVARARPLRAPKSASVRPTADRVKEALFSTLEALLLFGRPSAEMGSEELWVGLRVIDLYAGSGALGIEALSRGAAHALFVERDAGAVAAIRVNLAATGLADRATVRSGDAARLAHGGLPAADLVLMDPPYADPGVWDVADAIAESAWLARDSLVVVEHSGRLLTPAKLGTLEQQRERRYGQTVLTVYARGVYDRAGAGDVQEGC